MNLSDRILRGIAFMARLDMAAGVTIAVALLIWTAWH
jgi:hypothetical protein